MLDRVTITGADDSVRPADLIELSLRYPFVEWGILASRSNTGTPRYPTEHWVKAFQDVAVQAGAKLSLHLCGGYVRGILRGEDTVPAWMLEGFQRVQLNFHAERVRWDLDALHARLAKMSPRQFIFQLDDVDGNPLMDAVAAHNVGREKVDVVGLFDVSGGAGVLPDSWPLAASTTMQQSLYFGYAGGLGPDNLVEQIQAIAAAAGPFKHWIDMETRVRSYGSTTGATDDWLDLDKVETCLRIAQGFISRPDLYSRRA